MWLLFICTLAILVIVILIVLLCVNNKPRYFPDAHFNDIKGLKESKWYDYLRCIYTDNQLQKRIPFSMSDLWIIQTKFLPDSIRLENIPKAPTKYHTMFTDLDAHVSSEKNVIYIYQYNTVPFKMFKFSFMNYISNFSIVFEIINRIFNKSSSWNSPTDPHFKLKNGLPDNSLVEVERGADSIGGYTWFYYMPGTGNWFNLGKTISFSDHREAFSVAAEDGIKFKDPINGKSDDQFLLAKYFIGKKYDTIQFTQRAENVFKYEIFNLKNTQTKNAGACIPDIKTRGDQDCVCSPKLPYLNCSTGSPCGDITLPDI